MPRLLNRHTTYEERTMGNLPLKVEMFVCRLFWFPGNLRRFWRLPRLKVGDIYLDCGWHPVVATEVTIMYGSVFGPYDWDLAGVSLLDGSAPRSCSANHCAPRKMSYSVAAHIVSLMLGTDQSLEAALARRAAGEEHIKRIIDTSPELQELWR